MGTGLDVVYPSSNRDLWARVAERGVVLSESALGTKPHPGVFPARNRIIAALSDVVVVVESHRGGGSLYTAEAAARRSIPVCAVPGSVRSRASDGTNALLVDGCTPVRDAIDVLVAVSLAREGMEAFPPEARAARTTREHSRSESSLQRKTSDPTIGLPPGTGSTATERTGTGSTATERTGSTMTDCAGPGPDQCAVLDAIDDAPTRFETILIRTGLSIASAAEACDALVEQGLVIAGAGWWSRSQDFRTMAGAVDTGAGGRSQVLRERTLLPSDG